MPGSTGILVVAMCLASSFLPLVTIWMPEFQHYYVKTPPITRADVVTALDTRSNRCTQFSRNDLSLVGTLTAEEVDRAIAALEDSKIALPLLDAIPFTPGFAPGDLMKGGVREQLLAASLVAPDLMLRAFERDGDVAALSDAREYLEGWLRFESRALLPTGFQWNDHAVAARVFVLTRFLCDARSLPGFTPENGEPVLAAILASGGRLSKPDSFTFRTNHGIMQSLALLHIAASFPGLPAARRFGETGARRFIEQLDVYVSPEGSVNEHSAGYHSLGVGLLGMAIQYFEALGLDLPPGLRSRYEAARHLYASLKRPDGTLPSWGDTVRTAPGLGEDSGPDDDSRANQPERESWWGLASGYVIWWRDAGTPNREVAQTLVTWADFATGAHKHVDEMSVFVWTGRSDLLIGSGYWPPDARHYQDALGWQGANSPRFVGEPPSSRGITRLLGFADSSPVSFLDLERINGQGERLRRQVVSLPGERWVIIDSPANASRRNWEVSWLFDPSLSLKKEGDAEVKALDEQGPLATLQLLGCATGTWEIARGREQPFAGWTAADGLVRSAATLLRTCPSDVPAVTVIEAGGTGDGGKRDASALDVRVARADEWEILARDTGRPLLSRQNGRLVIAESSGERSCDPIEIEPGTEFDAQRAEIDRKYERLSATYSRYIESWAPYRRKITFGVLGVWAGLWIAQFLLWRWRGRYRHQMMLLLSGLAVVTSITLSVWLRFVYFA